MAKKSAAADKSDKASKKAETPPEPTVPATAEPTPGKVAHPAEKGTRHLRAPIEIRVEITARKPGGKECCGTECCEDPNIEHSK